MKRAENQELYPGFLAENDAITLAEELSRRFKVTVLVQPAPIGFVVVHLAPTLTKSVLARLRLYADGFIQGLHQKQRGNMQNIKPELAEAIVKANDQMEPFENEYKSRPLPDLPATRATRDERERCIEVVRHRIELLTKAGKKKYQSDIGELELLIINIISTGDGNGYIE
jgi:hypothetical protein